MKAILFSLLLLPMFLKNSKAQEALSYFLPEQDVVYDSHIPTPEAYFKQQMGEWHLNYEQVLAYMKEVASVSDRVIVREYARSHENRPLIHLIITSEENHSNLDQLRELHYRFSEPGSDVSAQTVPLVVFLGYGVHGNESSATNASVLSAYYLAAARGDKIDRLLKNTIIFIDPCLNPDGFTRHSTWANMHQGITDMISSDSRQYREVWPGGRTNHYWFDLNRDYLPLVHPESRGRVEKFHQWKPNIVTDHHEMGANSTFFFQPGVPSRNNPLTPEKNYILTGKIAEYHSRYLDSIGTFYFSEENFDDYYFGKGSSYPDVNGSIGILFEQAGFRGRIRETDNGIRKLAYGIRNQFAVTLSTLDAAVNMKDELLNFQKEFYEESLHLAENNSVKAFLFGSQTDRVNTEAFVDLLNRHHIDVFPNEREVVIEGKTFKPGSSYVVPVKQKNFRLIQSLFEEVTSFADSTFYDVSTWVFPFAYNLPFVKVTSLKEIGYSPERATAGEVTGRLLGGRSKVAYLFRWNEYSAPEALYLLQEEGLFTKVATDEFSFRLNDKMERFKRGSILVPLHNQSLDEEEIFRLVNDVAEKTGIDFYGLITGRSPEGIDAGSNSFVQLEKPGILMAAGNGVSSREAGEIWHLFDRDYQIPVCLAEPASFRHIDLSLYNVIILPGGSYNDLNGETATRIRQWVRAGGTLIACTRATAWTAKNELSKVRQKIGIDPDTINYQNYADRSKENSLNAIAGAIFNARMDLTHPICYGYINEELPFFKTGNQVTERLEEKFAEPVYVTENPYLSGFVSDENVDRIKGAPVVTVESSGSGKVISFHENMVFRGMWRGTGKMFSNAVFFGQVVR